MKTLLLLFCSFQILLNCNVDGYQNQIVWNSKNHYRQPNSRSAKKYSAADSLGKLTTSTLHDLYSRSGRNSNIVFSPFSIWSVLAALLEGSSGQTEKELKAKLKLLYSDHNEGRKIVRSRYQEINRYFQGIRGPTEFSSLNFAVSKTKVAPDFVKAFTQNYDGKYFNFVGKKNLFSVMVNSWAVDKSNGKITSLITQDMLDDLVLLIGNAVYFKSKWKNPFDVKDTALKPFKDEFGKVVGDAYMMFGTHMLSTGYSQKLESQFVEIPYADNRTSMIVILPEPKVPLKTVLSKLKNQSLKQVIPGDMMKEVVQLSLPRFQVTSNTFLKDILIQELPSMFSPQKADFPLLGKNLYVTQIVHKARIDNSEEGTTASGLSTVHLAFKTMSSVFQADRPFIYFINDIRTRSVIFCGTFTKPAPL